MPKFIPVKFTGYEDFIRWARDNVPYYEHKVVDGEMLTLNHSGEILAAKKLNSNEPFQLRSDVVEAMSNPEKETLKRQIKEYIHSEVAKGTRKANIEIELIHFIKDQLYKQD